MQPETQSARSRRSYGKIEDCEQSTLTTASVVMKTSLSADLHKRFSLDPTECIQLGCCTRYPFAGRIEQGTFFYCHSEILLLE